jgi:hypothetical protein
MNLEVTGTHKVHILYLANIYVTSSDFEKVTSATACKLLARRQKHYPSSCYKPAVRFTKYVFQDSRQTSRTFTRQLRRTYFLYHEVKIAPEWLRETVA